MLTEPVVDPEPGNDVPNKDSLETVDLANESEDGESDSETKVTEEDQLLILALVERAVGKEVGDTAAEAVVPASTLALSLLVVVVVASDVEEEVHGPATKLLADHVESGVDGSLLEELVHLVDSSAGAGSEDLASLRHEDHVALHVAGGLVVLAVADLPGEVGNEESRVAEPTDKVVQGLAVRERLVTALVGQDPETSAEQTLDEGVTCPKSCTERVRRDVFGRAELVEEDKCACQQGDVPSDVVKTSGR